MPSTRQRARQASLSSISEHHNSVPITPSISKHRRSRHPASIESEGRVFTGLFRCTKSTSGEGTIIYPSGDRYGQLPDSNHLYNASETFLHFADTMASSKTLSLKEMVSLHGCRVTCRRENSSKALFMGKAHSDRARTACHSNIVAAL